MRARNWEETDWRVWETPIKAWVREGKKKGILTCVSSPPGPDRWESLYYDINLFLTNVLTIDSLQCSCATSASFFRWRKWSTLDAKGKEQPMVGQQITCLLLRKFSISAFLPAAFAVESSNNYVAYWVIAFKRHRNISSYKNSLYIKKEEKEKKLKIYKSFVSKYEGNPGWGSSQPFIVDIHVSCFL